jgi:DNA-binding transcriptional regulator YiaG
LALRLDGALDRPIDIVQRLRAAGLSLRSAHGVITRLAADRHTVCVVAQGADVDALSTDLAAMRVRTARRRAPDASEIARVRARHGLSQREFADRLGIDLDTLRNWEQGRNKPDSAALSLVRIFDRAPELVLDAVFERQDP